MPGDDQGEKTEAPTARRRQEARERGQVARSMDLSSAVILLAALVALNFLGGGMFTRLGAMMGKLLAIPAGTAWDVAGMGETVRTCLVGIAMVLLPLLVTIMLAGLLGNLMQVGFIFSAEPLKPDLGKLNPIAGAKRMFSKKALVRLVMSLGKVAIVAGIAYATIRSRLGAIAGAARLGYREIVALGGELVFLLGIRVGVVLLALSILDFLYQRWQHGQDLKMSRQELKEDLKRMEGDPQIRARRQRVARQLAMQRMSMEVPRSTVVVTNPTHLSVALRYVEGMNAPRVVAKGAGFMAMRIRQIAAAAGVPIVERKPLARALFKGCEVGDEVPVNLYKAVAEILAYVYELAKHKKIGRRIPVTAVEGQAT